MMPSLIRKYFRYLLSGLPRVMRRAAPPGPGSEAAKAHGFSGDRSGVVAVLVALALPVLVGSMGLAAEASYWYVHQRGMQNAADAAAIAAATNGTSTYAAEAQAAAAQDGFQNGSGNITVAAPNPSTGCTALDPTANCYTVTVSDKVPLFLSQVVGYKGTGGKGTTTLSATAVAATLKAYPYCILALNGNVATDLVSHGGPKANLNGCNIMSDSSATCNGHNLGAAAAMRTGPTMAAESSKTPTRRGQRSLCEPRLQHSCEHLRRQLSAGAGEERPCASGGESNGAAVTP